MIAMHPSLLITLSLLLLIAPFRSMCTDSSIERRLARQLRTRSSPLTQKWYRDKQLHVSRAQKRAIQLHWSTVGIHLDFGRVLNLTTCFGRPFERYVLDIGFGSGESLVGMAQRHRSTGFLGCEIHRAGIGSALIKMHGDDSDPLENIRLIRSEVAVLLERHLAPACLDEICVFFPDPWPNLERDGERRVIRASMLPLFERALRSGGVVRVATDVEDYALHTAAVFSDSGASSRWQCLMSAKHEPCVGGPFDRPVTRYEERAKDLGNSVWDFRYRFMG